ncbi:MAG: hypothetical protein QXX99_04640 [Candidatus Bathyarchaeia archaeon]
MPSIKMLTINNSDKSIEEFLEIIWRALEYFPKGLWDEVKYLGDAAVRHDVKVEIKGISYGTFILDNLLDKVKRFRRTMKIKDLLLAVTMDPVIIMFSRLESEGIKHIVGLVHDYVSTDVGIISFFTVRDKNAVMVTAHGLGHNRGLRHHGKPIDLMYEGLLKNKALDKNGFCEDCLRKIVVN